MSTDVIVDPPLQDKDDADNLDEINETVESQEKDNHDDERIEEDPDMIEDASDIMVRNLFLKFYFMIHYLICNV